MKNKSDLNAARQGGVVKQDWGSRSSTVDDVRTVSNGGGGRGLQWGK